MKIIDRYLLRQFVQTFLICFLSLTGLYIVFDAFTNLDSFLRFAEKQGSLMGVLGRYYGCRSIMFFDRTLGLLTLTSAMFTITWIQRHQELTALMAAGISKVRVVKPVIIAVIVIILAGVVNRELVIPRFRDELAQRPKDLNGDAPHDLTPRRDEDTDILIRGDAAFSDRQRIEKPAFRLPRGLAPYAQIIAREAFYKPAEATRPAGFLLEGVEQPKDLHQQASLVLRDRPVIVTPRDAPDWLRPGQCFVVSTVTFEQLTNAQALREFSSTAQLIRGLYNQSLDYGASARVMVHTRIVQPFMDVTLLFLGLPLVLAKGSRNVFFAMGLCGAVVTVFMLVTMGFQHLGNSSYLSAAQAAWAPLLIFAPAAVEMAHTMRK